MFTIEQKIELNKKIKAYEGKNTFVLSLQKQLKNSKYLDKEDNGKGRMIKVLSEKQYSVAQTLVDK
jgi:hypothetical protein